ncbi:MAG TPA: 2,3-bisphosphoglycerate-independent phosphoglycerate mutase [Vicinamibacterales bacterium]|nr:2,3-bisphosphoglycerate-independent phosphoglycerate mutase [Vicinamibacterales bacterium]
MRRLPLVLIVLDGWGLREATGYNAIRLAKTPVYHDLLERYPHARLIASGEAVGLPAGQMGNSEVGHMNMGAGRVVYQDLTRIDKSIRDGDFFQNERLIAGMAPAVDGRHALHLVGLVSDGGVHSHQNHLHALLELARRRGVRRAFVHVITDGRDTSPTGGARYIAALEEALAKAGVGWIATVSGRYYAMDRDKRWDRTRLAYDAMTLGQADAKARSAKELIERSYAAGVTDEFVKPGVVTDADGQPAGVVRDGDAVIFFNFRADRARQLTRALAFDEFDGFERTVHPRLARYTTMTEYDQTFGLPAAFPPQSFTGNFAEALVGAGLSNLRLAETEKYAHVTYFFNCGEERPYAGEDRLLVPSPKVATYDLMPEMSAPGITEKLVGDLDSRRYDVVICNFANADMVGHTGDLTAAIKAVETLDGCLGRIMTAVRKAGGVSIVTADHGNAEQMWDDELKSPHTAHTSNPVPVILVDEQARGIRLREGGWLRDVAPTMLGLLEVPLPSEMTGKDLREK